MKRSPQAPEHEGNGGEQGDNSAKCDVSPRCGRQDGAVEEDVEAIQKVCHLGGDCEGEIFFGIKGKGKEELKCFCC